MIRTMSRLLFPLVVAITGIATMTALGHPPGSCSTADAQKCARVAPVVLPEKLPADNLAGTRVARPLRVSLPDFLNLGAAPRNRCVVDVIKYYAARGDAPRARDDRSRRSPPQSRTVSFTSILPRVALEYGQIVCALATSSSAFP